MKAALGVCQKVPSSQGPDSSRGWSICLRCRLAWSMVICNSVYRDPHFPHRSTTLLPPPPLPAPCQLHQPSTPYKSTVIWRRLISACSPGNRARPALMCRSQVRLGIVMLSSVNLPFKSEPGWAMVLPLSSKGQRPPQLMVQFPKDPRQPFGKRSPPCTPIDRADNSSDSESQSSNYGQIFKALLFKVLDWNDRISLGIWSRWGVRMYKYM